MPERFGSLQELIDIDVRDGMVVTPQGYAMVMKITPQDLLLKDDEDLERVEEQFRRALISLETPLQLYVRKVGYSIESYLGYWNGLFARTANGTADARRLNLISSYIGFIAERGVSGQYYRLEYYVIVPYGTGRTVGITQAVSWLSRLPLVGRLLGRGGGRARIVNDEKERAKALYDLRRRAGSVASIFEQNLDLTVEMLGDEALIRLLYQCLNPDRLQGDVAAGRDMTSLFTSYTRKSELDGEGAA